MSYLTKLTALKIKIPTDETLNLTSQTGVKPDIKQERKVVAPFHFYTIFQYQLCYDNYLLSLLHSILII